MVRAEPSTLGVFAIDTQANAEDDAILIFVVAVDYADEIDRGLGNDFKAIAEPLPRSCPGSDKTGIRAIVQSPNGL